MSPFDTHVLAFLAGIAFTLAVAAYAIPALKRF